MFVYSVRASALRFVAVLTAAVVVLALLVAFVPSYVPTSHLVGEEKVVYDNISSLGARMEFLAGFGWEIDAEREDASAVTVPAKFDAVYEDYNDIQRAQGLNLQRYRGKTVMRYTYPVKNYEGWDGEVWATMLVYKDRVIGGDICYASPQGFVHGFKKP